MRVGDLIELLQDMDQDAEVRVAYQPTYPIHEQVSAVAYTDDNEGQVFIGASGDSDYLVRDIQEQLNW